MILIQTGFYICGGIFALMVIVGLIAWAICAAINVYHRRQ